MKVETTSTYYDVAIIFTQQHSLVTVSLIDWPPMELIKFWHNWNSTKSAKICYETVRIKVIIWSIWKLLNVNEKHCRTCENVPVKIEKVLHIFIFLLWSIRLNFNNPQFYHFPVKFSKSLLSKLTKYFSISSSN